ncbi:hypothetical protein SARC_03000 [Sphaeroforma arctica JP610]|uniref:Uncharacterized protein n=1 Tax=Sphaeroforma arctica JP610 TaxID=667725 RepID=A0A0L0G6Y7_9EUKA|nr:hypothetical protein SARC_03000 [Sphaeroforma arctica JP610]KNC84792.1 hypothetical protein SARC_03000 [Sphaeroforma arctica JP610]|eukprot:XP_014158694.1 hypothetical protein SARC_03000 [Sphaeroforma arctica JP610]
MGKDKLHKGDYDRIKRLAHRVVAVITQASHNHNHKQSSGGDATVMYGDSQPIREHSGRSISGNTQSETASNTTLTSIYEKRKLPHIPDRTDEHDRQHAHDMNPDCHHHRHNATKHDKRIKHRAAVDDSDLEDYRLSEVLLSDMDPGN